ncbi:MAG: SoxR reducing system RseC family protein [Oscillospiraceae bacterium]|jgi:sigma-E factor negative regulatory protein RseC|nr:SoxR reducing system RseC family protein [Oscillospiraceae bacterium]
MTGSAVVMSVAGANTATVRVARESACGDKCATCSGCADRREMIFVTAVNKVGAKAGDRVQIEGSTKETLRLAALVYLLPVVLFLIGWIFHPLAGALGMLFAVAAVFAINRRLQRRGGVTVHITAIEQSDPDGGDADT